MAAEGAHGATELLVARQNGDGDALGRLLSLVYAELHRLAARQFRRDRPDHTLQATALVHEVTLATTAATDGAPLFPAKEPARWRNPAF